MLNRSPKIVTDPDVLSSRALSAFDQAAADLERASELYKADAVSFAQQAEALNAAAGEAASRAAKTSDQASRIRTLIG